MRPPTETNKVGTGTRGDPPTRKCPPLGGFVLLGNPETGWLPQVDGKRANRGFAFRREKLRSSAALSVRSRVTAQALLIASSGSAIWKLARLEGFANRSKIQDHAKRDARSGTGEKPSAPTAGADDRTDDCACGADHDDVAVPAKVQISTFSNDR